jgi:hypothetical protein
VQKSPLAQRFRGFLPVVVDIETGGFNCETDALLEIAAVLVDNDVAGSQVHADLGGLMSADEEGIEEVADVVFIGPGSSVLNGEADGRSPLGIAAVFETSSRGIASLSKTAAKVPSLGIAPAPPILAQSEALPADSRPPRCGRSWERLNALCRCRPAVAGLSPGIRIAG